MMKYVREFHENIISICIPIYNAGATIPNCDTSTNSDIIDSIEGVTGPNGDAKLETSATGPSCDNNTNSDISGFISTQFVWGD